MHLAVRNPVSASETGSINPLIKSGFFIVLRGFRVIISIGGNEIRRERVEKTFVAIILAVILVLAVGKSIFALDAAVISQELEKMNIEVVGLGEQTDAELPNEFSGPYWGLLRNICRDSGWDLSAYAGKKVLMSLFPIKETYGDELLNVRVISYGDEIIAVYKTVRDGSRLAPGIFPVERVNNK